MKIYNTLSKQKEIFSPINENSVSFYLCGVTVYDDCHIGHARAYVSFDVVRRFLEYSNYDVTFVQNFTDVDDKIIKRANELKISSDELTQKYIQHYYRDMDKLGVKRAHKYPRATKYIGEMIKLISTLIQKEIAYELHGDVCFSIDKFPDYGKLSKKVLEDLESGTRVEVDQEKRNPLDFVLWKKAKPEEPSWDSPWGKGRPGWHIECSAMAIKELGPSIDIHAGGIDLIFPHHENEIAQSESCTGKPFSKYWMHNGFVNIKNQKMSKSLGNFITLQEILTQYPGEVLRFYLIKSHYRSMLNFSPDGIDESKQALQRLHQTLKTVTNLDIPKDKVEEFARLETRFIEAMKDDFNTPEAIGVLFDLNKLINSSKAGVGLLRKLGGILGLFYDDVIDDDIEMTEELQLLLEKRNKAKQEKDFKTSDEVRDFLLTEYQLKIEDTREGVRLRRA
ncbi:cysteine--tRNA ligase [Candidatus Marinamargulisbacteria bacterium SCGC AAA071-K20]|nr:cysteine--tRNA ligase [Candidatus Marinamargulisbacteria bacterium SCGC AAA071-K20]